MKHAPVLILFALFILTACTKSKEETAGVFPKNITGKWNYAQRFYSPGGPFVYESTIELRQWVIFDNSSKLSSNMPPFENFGKYNIIDSVKLKLSSGSQADRVYYYKIDSVKNSLTLTPADYLCIEGCGDVFRR